VYFICKRGNIISTLLRDVQLSVLAGWTRISRHISSATLTKVEHRATRPPSPSPVLGPPREVGRGTSRGYRLVPTQGWTQHPNLTCGDGPMTSSACPTNCISAASRLDTVHHVHIPTRWSPSRRHLHSTLSLLLPPLLTYPVVPQAKNRPATERRAGPASGSEPRRDVRDIWDLSRLNRPPNPSCCRRCHSCCCCSPCCCCCCAYTCSQSSSRWSLNRSQMLDVRLCCLVRVPAAEAGGDGESRLGRRLIL
jgi:hypothetical protein